MGHSQKKENQLLLGMFGLVILMAVPTYHSLAMDVPIMRDDSVGAPSEVRGVASIPASLPLMPEKIFAEFNLGCDNPQAVQEVTNHLVHIRGKSCDKKIDLQKVTITNEKNGFSATLFAASSNSFQTDLIHLESGDNPIKVVIKKSNNSVIEERFIIKNNNVK